MTGEGFFKCFYHIDIIDEFVFNLEYDARSHIRHFPAIIVDGLRGLSLRDLDR